MLITETIPTFLLFNAFIFNLYNYFLYRLKLVFFGFSFQFELVLIKLLKNNWSIYWINCYFKYVCLNMSITPTLCLLSEDLFTRILYYV